jgi:hypothetical protein
MHTYRQHIKFFSPNPSKIEAFIVDSQTKEKLNKASTFIVLSGEWRNPNLHNLDC